ncbi:MAG: hypothetical protein ACHQBP_04700 [Acidimicrobiales bacterium]
MIVVAISAVNDVWVVAIEHHHWTTGLANSVILFIIATVLLGSIVYAFNYSIHPIKVLLADVKGHLDDHPPGTSSPQVKAKPAPLLVVTRVPGGSRGHLFESAPSNGYGIVPGCIYVTVKVNVSAPDNQPTLTILRVRAAIQFYDGDIQESETSQFESFDVMATGRVSPEAGPTYILQGRTLQLSCQFIGRAQNSVPGSQFVYELPTVPLVARLTVFDSLDRSYELAEPFKFPVSRWEDQTPFQPG